MAIIRFRQILRRFVREGDGVSAVEFALLVPVMLILYIGTAEVGNAISLQFKVTQATRTLADLASRYDNANNPITTTIMSNILNAAFTVVAPYSSTGMAVTVSEVGTNSSGNATISWSCALQGTAHSFGASVTLPSNVNSPSIYIIMGEATYSYTPPIGYVLTGTITISQKMYFYPRSTTSVTGPSSSSNCPTS